MKLKMTTGCMSVMTCLALLEYCLVYIIFWKLKPEKDLQFIRRMVPN